MNERRIWISRDASPNPVGGPTACRLQLPGAKGATFSVAVLTRRIQVVARVRKGDFSEIRGLLGMRVRC